MRMSLVRSRQAAAHLQGFAKMLLDSEAARWRPQGGTFEIGARSGILGSNWASRVNFFASCLLMFATSFFMLQPPQAGFGVVVVLAAFSVIHFRYSIRSIHRANWRSTLGVFFCISTWLWASWRAAIRQDLDLLTNSLFALGTFGLLELAEDLNPDWGKEDSRDATRFWLFNALALVAVILIARYLLVLCYGEKTFDFYGVFLFYIPRYRGADQGIPTAAFDAWPRLLLPILWFLALLWSYPRLLRAPKAWGLSGLFLLAFFGKFSISFLNFGGWQSLAYETSSVATHYFELAEKIRGRELEFVHYFNWIQPKLGTHGATHPFGPELFYDLLIRIVGDRPLEVAALMSVLTAPTCLAIWGIARELGVDYEKSFGVAMLYAMAPPNLILAESGIDCVFASCTAFGLWLMLRSLRQRDLLLPVLLGLLIFGMSLLSQAAIVLPMMGLYVAFPHLKRLESRRFALAWIALIFTVPLLAHLELWWATGTSFRYDQVVALAGQVHDAVFGRPYSLWVWGNALLYLGYAGLGTATLYLLRLKELWWRGSAWSRFDRLGLAMLATMLLSGLGRGEIQRLFLWSYLFVILGAGPWATENSSRFRITLALNYFSAVLLEMLVLDYW